MKSAFINGPLDEVMYVTQPSGFKVKVKEYMVFRLHKVLYGLKQASRAYNKRIDNFLVQQEFVKCKAEYGVYVKNSKDNNLILICLYGDYLIVIGSNLAKI